MAIFVHRNESSIEITSTALRCERLRACSDILSDAWSGRPYETQQPSFTVLLSRAIFMWSWIRLSLSIQHTSWALWFSMWKNLRVFMNLNSAGKLQEKLLNWTCQAFVLFNQSDYLNQTGSWYAYWSVLYECIEHADDTDVRFWN